MSAGDSAAALNLSPPRSAHPPALPPSAAKKPLLHSGHRRYEYIVPSVHKDAPEREQPRDKITDKRTLLYLEIESVTGLVPTHLAQLYRNVQAHLSAVAAEDEADPTPREPLPVLRNQLRKLSRKLHTKALNDMTDWLYRGTDLNQPKAESAVRSPDAAINTFSLEIMSMAASSQHIPLYDNRSGMALAIDWRYFYVVGKEEQVTVRAVSDLARVAAAEALSLATRKVDHGKKLETLNSLVQAMGVNPSVKGFIIEAFVNSCLAWCALDTLPKKLIDSFPGWPARVAECRHYGSKKKPPGRKDISDPGLTPPCCCLCNGTGR